MTRLTRASDLTSAPISDGTIFAIDLAIKTSISERGLASGCATVAAEFIREPISEVIRFVQEHGYTGTFVADQKEGDYYKIEWPGALSGLGLEADEALREIERLRAQLADCTASHQRANEEIERLDAALDGHKACSPDGFGLCDTHPTCDCVCESLRSAHVAAERLRTDYQSIAILCTDRGADLRQVAEWAFAERANDNLYMSDGSPIHKILERHRIK